MNPQDAFLDLLIAAMKDAAIGGNLSQLKTSIDADGKGAKIIRIIVIPEKMDFDFPLDRPLGSTSKHN